MWSKIFHFHIRQWELSYIPGCRCWSRPLFSGSQGPCPDSQPALLADNWHCCQTGEERTTVRWVGQTVSCCTEATPCKGRIRLLELHHRYAVCQSLTQIAILVTQIHHWRPVTQTGTPPLGACNRLWGSVTQLQWTTMEHQANSPRCQSEEPIQYLLYN